MSLKHLQLLSRINLNLIRRHYSTTKPYKIVTTSDDTTFVSWHPEEEFPYECTKPLPTIKEESDTVLKTQLTPAVKSIFNKTTQEQARQELMDLTSTTKHRWYPRARDKRAKKTVMDREYL